MNRLVSSIQQPPAQKKKLAVAGQLGCASAMVLQNKYASYILSHDYERTDSFGDADVILVDTCGATLEQENASLALIAKQQQKAKPGAKVIVSGCLAAISPERIAQVFSGDLFSPSNEFMLGRILGFDSEEDKFLEPYEAPGRFMGAEDPSVLMPQARRLAAAMLALHRVNNLLPGQGLTTLPVFKTLIHVSQQCNSRNYTLNISQGCMGECTFCVIPKAKGRTKSLPIGLIVEKIRQKAAEGVRHITLASEDTGAYGVDIGTDIVNLLWKIHAVPGDFVVYLNFFDPRWLKSRGARLLEFLKTGRVRYLQCTLQSGSDQVLKRMKRGYTVAQAMAPLRRIRAECPDLTLTTQLIAGFPGETSQDLAATRRLIEEDVFDHLWVFEFSQRPGAETETMDGCLPEQTIRERARKLRRAWWGSLARMTLGLRRGVAAPPDSEAFGV